MNGHSLFFHLFFFRLERSTFSRLLTSLVWGVPTKKWWQQKKEKEQMPSDWSPTALEPIGNDGKRNLFSRKEREKTQHAIVSIKHFLPFDRTLVSPSPFSVRFFSLFLLSPVSSFPIFNLPLTMRVFLLAIQVLGLYFSKSPTYLWAVQRDLTTA